MALAPPNFYRENAMQHYSGLLRNPPWYLGALKSPLHFGGFHDAPGGSGGGGGGSTPGGGGVLGNPSPVPGPTSVNPGVPGGGSTPDGRGGNTQTQFRGPTYTWDANNPGQFMTMGGMSPFDPTTPWMPGHDQGRGDTTLQPGMTAASFMQPQAYGSWGAPGMGTGGRGEGAAFDRPGTPPGWGGFTPTDDLDLSMSWVRYMQGLPGNWAPYIGKGAGPWGSQVDQLYAPDRGT